MSGYRDNKDLDTQRGKVAQTIHRLVRRGTLSEYQANEVVNVLLAEFGAQTNRRPMDQASPVGLVARSADPSRTEFVVVNVHGNDKHPVAVAALDWSRQAVIDEAGLEADETLLHNSQRMVKLDADGFVLMGAFSGIEKALALLEDVQSLNARVSALEGNFNAHTHAANGTPPGVPSNTTATINGTAYLREVD